MTAQLSIILDRQHNHRQPAHAGRGAHADREALVGVPYAGNQASTISGGLDGWRSVRSIPGGSWARTSVRV
jgi:hypothetical protein